MTDAEEGRVEFEQRLGPCVGDWYKKKDGTRHRFGLDLVESLQLAADTSGKFFSLDAEGFAVYGGNLLPEFILKSSLGRPEAGEEPRARERGLFGQVWANCRVFEEK